MNSTRSGRESPLRALIYSRVSIDQTGEGKSNDRQEEECRRLIEYERWEQVGPPERDAQSAYSTKARPGWERVLAKVVAGEVDVIVAYHLDRLLRNMGDLERLIILCEEHNVSIKTATGDLDLTNDTGRMVARILAAVARQEVERKAARQRLAHAQRRADGRPWTAVKAFGYTNHGEIIESEAEPIRVAARDFLAGTALAEIARRWDRAGLTNSYNVGKGWTTSGVRLVLANPRNAGFMVHGKEVKGRGDWTPILDETTHTLIRAKLADPSRKAGTSTMGRKATHLLTGIARCGAEVEIDGTATTCGETLRAGVARGVPTYTCGKWHTTVPRDIADALVSVAVASTAPEAAGLGPVDVAGLVAEVDALNAQLEALSMSYARRAITIEQLEAASASIGSEIDAAQRAIGDVGEVGLLTDEEQVAQVVAFADSDDLATKRAVLTRHAVVTIHPKGRGKAALSPEQQVTVHMRSTDGTLRTVHDLRPGHEPVLAQPSDLVRADALERVAALS